MKTLKTLGGLIAACMLVFGLSFSPVQAFNCTGDGDCIIEYNGGPLVCALVSIELKSGSLMGACPNQYAEIDFKVLDCPGGLEMRLYPPNGDSWFFLSGTNCPGGFPATPRVELYCEAEVPGSGMMHNASGTPLVLEATNPVFSWPPAGIITYEVTSDIELTDNALNVLTIRAGSLVHMSTE